MSKNHEAKVYAAAVLRAKAKRHQEFKKLIEAVNKPPHHLIAGQVQRVLTSCIELDDAIDVAVSEITSKMKAMLRQ